jgi:hypothetical protein
MPGIRRRPLVDGQGNGRSTIPLGPINIAAIGDVSRAEVANMSRAARASSRLLVTVVLGAVAAMGAGGCVLVPAPYPVAGYGPPVVVAPRPVVVAPGPYYRYGHGGYHRWR